MTVPRPNLRIPRFTVSPLHEMREAGILAARARVELLDGVLVDMPRPTEREMEITRRVAEVLTERLGNATVQPGEPFHPEAYATFDPTLMVHDWETLPLTRPYRLHRFSVDEYRSLVEAGVLPSQNRYELLDGVVLEADPRRGRLRRRIEHAARLVRERVHSNIVRVREPVRLGPFSLLRPDVAVCRDRADGYRVGPPRGEDVVLALDVADDRADDISSLRWAVYARWEIRTTWLVDLQKSIVRVGQEPCRSDYARVETYRSGQTLRAPAAFADIVIGVGDLVG